MAATMTSKVEVLPPPYHLKPDVSPMRTQYEDHRYPLRVETDVQQRKVDSGQFLTGTVTVHAITDFDKDATLTLTIWNRISVYKNKHKFLSRSSKLHQSNMSKLNRSVIPITGPLKRGLSYSFPFSVQFPEHTALPSCDCDGRIHSASPPSCVTGNVHVEYHLTAIIRHQSKRCWQSFFYQPSNSTLNLKNFYDVHGQSLMRKHTSLRSPHLNASAWPVFNSPDQSSGYIRVYTTGNVRIDTVRTTIVQHTATNPEGFGNVILKDGTQQTKTISTSTLIGSWAPGVGQIDVPYELPSKYMLPSHIGCYSAVLYFFKIVLRHGHEECVLTVPLSICSETSVPEYVTPATPLKM